MEQAWLLWFSTNVNEYINEHWPDHIWRYNTGLEPGNQF